jgi:hypothetical protein
MATSSLGYLHPDIASPVLLSSISTGSVTGSNLAGTATIVSGATTVAVAFAIPEPDATYVVIAAPYTKGTNAAYVTGANTLATSGFNITCNTDPGSGGLVVAWMIIRTA